ncbi:tagatose-bisphosphate aldolase noncatalytic subunit [Palleronia aestuarii]|uniref:Tagatose-bisphosphate aldolase noncatalytic subunit n=1 Tax=Palleronia aestuarii TaxID=568105 RepID=A0A2W7NA77_9RHOB|nr:class II D-tagatose-bisphosphate aldolase, non-catalytic subunit [Palleronia aestuarii]PZX13764.1 tagatose-bisphosphate aldolase noncatalytic subunit [Palleronia aestuarii]
MKLSLADLAGTRATPTPRGLVSVCSAHPLVLRATLRHARDTETTALIEATCNQVNHHGGYTGMTPADFAELTRRIAREEGCDEALILLGGDHLGPNPWRDRPAEEALAEAGRMVADYVAAGFSKLHLDASMGCAGEPEQTDDDLAAERAARLAATAEDAAKTAGLPPPHYVIGTEVPPPGGADHAVDAVTPTAPEAARRTIDVHRDVFAKAGLEEAFERVVAAVVQPGVEFGVSGVAIYDPEAAAGLSALLDDRPDLVFEAHSTDYQGEAPLAALVRTGFQILKVGPELTFVMREALYALDAIAADLLPERKGRALFAAMESAMQGDPRHWKRHYADSEAHWQRHYAFSDRIRYYWPGAQHALDDLFHAIEGRRIPLPLLMQHAPWALSAADTPLDPAAFVMDRIRVSLDAYHAAAKDIS